MTSGVSFLRRIRSSKLSQVAGVLPKADSPLASAWWTMLLMRGCLPAFFAITTGMLVGAVQRRADLSGTLTVFGILFIALQILPPLHRTVGANLGNRTAAWLYDQLAQACVRPPGMGHLENPALTTDLSMARDFDLGITGPPWRSRWISSRAGWWN